MSLLFEVPKCFNKVSQKLESMSSINSIFYFKNKQLFKALLILGMTQPTMGGWSYLPCLWPEYWLDV